jgi:hypothetical protein
MVVMKEGILRVVEKEYHGEREVLDICGVEVCS